MIKRLKNVRFLSTLVFLVLVSLVGLILAACGGGAPPEPAAEPPAPEEAVVEEAPAEEAAPEETVAEEPAAEEPAAEEAMAEEPAEEAPAEEEAATPAEPLLLLEWSGYEASEYPQFFVPFTDKYADNLSDVVDYSFFADDAEAIAKVQTGFGADLIHPCNSWWALYVEHGLLQPIDTSRLSNWSSIHPDLAKMGEFDGQQYFVPWDWGYESILVRNDLVEETPDSWADLWDPQYAGHVALWDSAETNYIIAALALGIEDPWNTTPEQDEQIKQKLIEIKPNLLTYWSDYTEAYDLPAAGDTWLLSNAWQDAYAYLQSDEYDVSYIQPEEGRLGWVCGYALNANADNVDLAYEYLDAAISKESMAALSNEYWYGAANVDAIGLIDEYVVEFMELDQADTLTERTVFYQPLTQEQRQIRTSLWDEVKAAP
jgi:spermidine/putrescine-binding protein